jgi:hypothetical protein
MRPGDGPPLAPTRYNLLPNPDSRAKRSLRPRLATGLIGHLEINRQPHPRLTSMKEGDKYAIEA